MLQAVVDELIRDVRITLDENAEQSAYIQDNRDNLGLDELIKSKLPDAARDISEQSPVEMLEPLDMETTVTASDGGGSITVPDDFLRLVSLKMKGWNRGVTVIAGEGSDVEMMQRNPYTRGTRIKPVAVFSRDSKGNKVIEYFGAGSEIEKALYVPIPSIVTDEEGRETIDIPRLLRQAIVRRTAGLVLLSRGDVELAGQFLS